MPFAVTGRLIRSGTEPALPPLHRQALNASRAAGRAVAAMATGRKLWLTPAQRDEHQAICRSNQCGFFRVSDARCAHPDCGCFTKLKTRLATETCPAGLFSPTLTAKDAPPSG